MTREQFVEMICWEWIIWGFGLLNVVAMLPQLYKIWMTTDVKGLSTWTFALYFFIQLALSVDGFLKRNEMLMWCMGLSAAVSGVAITSIWYLK